MKTAAKWLVGVLYFFWMALLVFAGGLALVRNFGYVLKLWKWPFLFSPAFYLYALASMNAVWLPIWACGLFPQHLAAMKLSLPRGLCMAALAMLGLVGVNYVCQALAWGSFPLTRDPNGDFYIRMIPFLPWPNYPFYF